MESSNFENAWEDSENNARMAKVQYDDEDTEGALESLEKAIEVNPNKSEWHFNKGLALDSLERFEEAIESFEKADELTTDDLDILKSLAVDYTRTKRYGESLELFERITEMDPTFEPSYCNRIVTYSEMEDLEKAEEMFYMAQTLDENCPVCFYNVGNIQFMKKNFEKALFCWEKTKELGPTHPQIDYFIGHANWANGNKDAALQSFLSGIRTDPENPDIHLSRAILAMDQGELVKSRVLLDEMRYTHGDDFHTNFYLAEAMRLQGDIENAKEYYLHALKINPGLPGPRFRLGELELKRGDLPTAAHLLRKEFEINDLEFRGPTIPNNLGAMLYRVGEMEMASERFAFALDSDPKHIPTINNMAASLYQQDDFNNAGIFSDYALNIDPDHMPLTKALNYLSMQRKNFGNARVSARKWLKKNLPLDYTSPNIYPSRYSGNNMAIGEENSADLPPLMVRKSYWKSS